MLISKDQKQIKNCTMVDVREMFYGRHNAVSPDLPFQKLKIIMVTISNNYFFQAAFHYQNYGPPQGGDPLSVANVNAVTNFIEKKMYECQRRCDWLNFYRNMLLRDLVSQVVFFLFEKRLSPVSLTKWTASSEFGTYSLCEQRRFRRACASAQSHQNLRCSLIQADSQEEHSDRKPNPWPH